MRKTIYCTLDTETVGGASNPTGMYNLGCIIHDKDGNIFATTSMIIMEHYNKIKDDNYAKKNFSLYQERLSTGVMSAVATEEDAIKIVRNLCKFYNVKYVMAYNSAFDFTKTICKTLLDEFEFIDIYLMALQTITHLKSYATFCRKNNMLSRNKKTLATTAESIYAFIIDDANYTEEHTALEDSKIEMMIFLRCLKMHKHFTKNIHQWDCKEYNKCFPSL